MATKKTSTRRSTPKKVDPVEQAVKQAAQNGPRKRRFTVAQLSDEKKAEWQKNPPTENQLELLEDLGIELSDDELAGMSQYDVGEVIDKYFVERDQGPASEQQIGWLFDLGVDEDVSREMTYGQAYRAIQTIKARQKSAKN